MSLLDLTTESYRRRKAMQMASDKVKEINDARAAALKRDPDLPVKEYALSRKALGNEFDSSTVLGSKVQACPMSTKAGRRAQRKSLIQDALKNAPNNRSVRAAAERLRREMDDVERARLAKHVYLDPQDVNLPDDLRDMKAPPGFEAPSEEELNSLGLTSEDLQPDSSNFKAQVYKYDPEIWGDDYKGKYAIAFRGSTTDLEDWENNFLNGAKLDSEYYKRAKLIGAKVNAMGKSSDVDLVGHSLGGGLAQAAQSGSNGAMRVTTFNSAGVHDKLASQYGIAGQFNEDKISAYRVKGEVLTQAQEHGTSRWLLPSAKGQKYDLEAHDPALRHKGLTDNDRTELHGIDGTILSIEDQKTADEKLLGQTIGSS